jgi:hypothetical protein
LNARPRRERDQRALGGGVPTRGQRRTVRARRTRGHRRDAPPASCFVTVTEQGIRRGFTLVASAQLVSVTIAATLGTHEPLRGQIRIALNNGVSKDEIVELFIHLEAYAGAARAFDGYQIALQVFAENGGPTTA